MKSFAIALALIGLISTPALAQNKSNNKAKPTKTVKKGKKAVKACADKSRPDCAKLIDFGKGDKIDGDRPAGDGDTLIAVAQRHFGSLINLRVSFVPEILKSAEGI